MRTAIVTGAASGIGRAIAVHFANEDWRVAALDIDHDGLASLPKVGIQPIWCDLSSEESICAAVAEAGFEQLDLLVNNGGPADPVAGRLEEMSLNDWNSWIAPHLNGSFLMARECMPYLRAAKGSIVNMTSTRAYQSEPDTYGYAAAKGGIIGLTHALAIGLGPDVRANAIAPGWINSTGDVLSGEAHAQHPVGRVGEVEDIVHAVAYLSGAGFVTGQVLTVDGGMTRRMIYTA
ncbi:SDR family oxidoreductase [Hyphomonas sp. UBA4494]|jgi:NAD(P)-dependent dehydrogenase (short-subunit alcohol dehydrogenase family)|uniref:SDR family oxidoreductase n=1 Tax=Hyphomonas sp. UBA4494 TaxID=1946631 RepID=UPI0025C596BB|nr:SDR family oxidoreductase [Hyphomonas sp. UBA4494]